MRGTPRPAFPGAIDSTLTPVYAGPSDGIAKSSPERTGTAVRAGSVDGSSPARNASRSAPTAAVGSRLSTVSESRKGGAVIANPVARRRSSQEKPVLEWIFAVQHEPMPARAERRTGHLGDHRGTTGNRHIRGDSSDEPGADDGVMAQHAAIADPPVGRQQGHPCRGAGPARRTVDLAVGEHRDVALMRSPLAVAQVVEQNRAVAAR